MQSHESRHGVRRIWEPVMGSHPAAAFVLLMLLVIVLPRLARRARKRKMDRLNSKENASNRDPPDLN
jgi:hypothetical protein